MYQLHFKISGLICPACVKLSEKRISTIDGIQSIQINQDGKSNISSDREVGLDEIRAVLEDTEYKIS